MKFDNFLNYFLFAEISFKSSKKNLRDKNKTNDWNRYLRVTVIDWYFQRYISKAQSYAILILKIFQFIKGLFVIYPLVLQK